MVQILKKIRFNTIFWKIFLSYWLVMLIIVAATFVVVALFADRDRLEWERRFSVQAKANTLMTVYEHGGAKAVSRWLHRRDHGKGGRVYLLNDELVDLLGKSVPDQLKQAWRDGRTEYLGNNRPRLVLKVLGADERVYWVAGLAPHHHAKPGFPGRRWVPLFPFKGLSALLALLVTGAISFLLARNITSPIRQLQVTAQRMAGGDLSARVADNVEKRRDELGELGRDFNGMAEEIDRLLSTQQRMLRDVSHELRSPLARLQVALGLARKAAGEQCEKDHDRIEKEIDRLDELIGQVISLVRLETSEQDLNKSGVQLSAVLTAIVDDANFEAGSQKKRVALEIETEAEILADAELIHSALENVVRNAVAYTAEDTTVSVALAADETHHIISVLDQGPGVPESALTSLFEPFYREAAARDRASGGYGLGLAIAQRAIRLHGGDIIAQNHISGGLEIVITLPRSSAIH